MGSNKPSVSSTATPTSTPAIEANIPSSISSNSNGSDVWTQVKAGIKELIHVATEGLRTYVDPAYAALGPVVFLGRKYAGLKDPA
ncbi:UNVERIFIED_CONTAM: hypothetical protein HDU68_002675, partial [Siphonaria sp. JEL0065]